MFTLMFLVPNILPSTFALNTSSSLLSAFHDRTEAVCFWRGDLKRNKWCAEFLDSGETGRRLQTADSRSGSHLSVRLSWNPEVLHRPHNSRPPPSAAFAESSRWGFGIFRPKLCYRINHARYMPTLSRTNRFDHQNNIWWSEIRKVEICCNWYWFSSVRQCYQHTNVTMHC